MDWLLSLLALFNLLSMVAVFAPRRVPKVWIPWLVFTFALLATELAWFWLPLQALFAGLLIWGGALGSTLGGLAFAVLVMSWVGLVVSIILGLRSGDPVEQSLKAVLGHAYRNEIPESARAGLSDEVRFADWRRPFAMRIPGVEKISNIPYAEGGIRRKLDIYRPTAIPPEGCPVLLQIHGGAWVIGDKNRQALPLMNYLTSKGWICVAANYRLSPSVGFPVHLQDIKTALGWIRTHGKEYGMNTDFVAVTGGSAGGHLCALMGLTANRKALQPECPDVDTRVQACVPFYGVYDLHHRGEPLQHMELFRPFMEEQVMHCCAEDNPELWDLASPILQVDEDAPPFMVLHGSRDSLAMVEDARAFAYKLGEVSKNPAAYLELPGAEHAFEIMHSPRTAHTIRGVHRFLEWARAQAQQ